MGGGGGLAGGLAGGMPVATVLWDPCCPAVSADVCVCCCCCVALCCAAAEKILGKEPELKADFSRAAQAISKARQKGVPRFLPNPSER